MKRTDLEHLIRAAGNLADTREIVIIGSQAILGAFPEPPAELAISEEADTFPLHEPSKADLIDGSIGEKSPFHETFGYYAHGVGPDTAVLASHWRERLIPICNENTRGITGLCLHPVDIAVSKLAAGREKDIEFVIAMLRHNLVRPEAIQQLCQEVAPERIPQIQARMASCLRELSRGQ